MKRPIFDMDCRFQMIHKTANGEGLMLKLSILKLQREFDKTNLGKFFKWCVDVL